jgi:transcriptional regulator with XRE-family HTH domain
MITMRTPDHALLPSLQRLVSTVGENMRLARLRRKFSASLIAERAGISRTTLSAIEHGDPSVSFGAYARVLLALSLEQDLTLIARDDTLGRKLQDLNMVIKRRAPRRARPESGDTATVSGTEELPS